jgi:hypothetical protein
MSENQNQIDFDQLALDEVETIENIAGVAIDKIVRDGVPKGKNLKAIMFVLKRRENPDFKIEDAGKFTVADVTAIFGGDDSKKA